MLAQQVVVSIPPGAFLVIPVALWLVSLLHVASWKSKGKYLAVMKNGGLCVSTLLADPHQRAYSKGHIYLHVGAELDSCRDVIS